MVRPSALMVGKRSFASLKLIASLTGVPNDDCRLMRLVTHRSASVPEVGVPDRYMVSSSSLSRGPFQLPLPRPASIVGGPNREVESHLTGAGSMSGVSTEASLSWPFPEPQAANNNSATTDACRNNADCWYGSGSLTHMFRIGWVIAMQPLDRKPRYWGDTGTRVNFRLVPLSPYWPLPDPHEYVALRRSCSPCKLLSSPELVRQVYVHWQLKWLWCFRLRSYPAHGSLVLL